MIQGGEPCRVASPFPFLPNVPVLPPDTIYVPGTCVLFGIGCPPGYPPDPHPADAGTCRDYQGTIRCHCYDTLLGSPSGNYEQQPDGWWCEVGG
jgi:hypothetical protein